MKKLLNIRGFTLIELIVVIAILAILAMILIPSLTGFISKARNTKNATNCRSLYTRYQLAVSIATGTATVAKPTTNLGGLTITVPAAAVLPRTTLTDFRCRVIINTKTYYFGLIGGTTGGVTWPANFGVAP